MFYDLKCHSNNTMTAYVSTTLSHYNHKGNYSISLIYVQGDYNLVSFEGSDLISSVGNITISVTTKEDQTPPIIATQGISNSL
jgi:hypothetical protein